MSDDGEDLEEYAHHATIRSAAWGKLAAIVAVLTLAWTIFADVVITEDSPSAKDSHQSKQTEADADAKDESKEDDSSFVSDIGAYFEDAAYNTDDWRGGQAVWQLGLWWVALALFFFWLVGSQWLPTFRTSAIIQASYLWIFWPSLSGFGAGLSLGLWLLVTIFVFLEFD